MQPVVAEVVRLLSRVLSISRDKGSAVFPKPGHGGFDVSSVETVFRFIAFAPDDSRVLEKHGYACPAFFRLTQSGARKEVVPEDQNEQLPGGFYKSCPLIKSFFNGTLLTLLYKSCEAAGFSHISKNE